MDTKKEVRQNRLLNVLIGLLIILWVYASLSKILVFDQFLSQLRMQGFHPGFIRPIAYLLPSSELLTAILLTHLPTRKTGLYASWLLLVIFTLYIVYILSGISHQGIPCSCGGILEQLGWKSHLSFNLFFLLLNSISIFFLLKMKGG